MYIFGVLCLPRVTDFSTVAKFEEHARECRIMGVVSHYKQAVRYGRCVSESEREFVRNIGALTMVLNPFLNLLCQRLECRNNTGVSLYM